MVANHRSSDAMFAMYRSSLSEDKMSFSCDFQNWVKRATLRIEIVYLAMTKWPKDNSHFLTNNFYRKVLCLQALFWYNTVFSTFPFPLHLSLWHMGGDSLSEMHKTRQKLRSVSFLDFCVHCIWLSPLSSRKVFNASDSQSYLIFVNFGTAPHYQFN